MLLESTAVPVPSELVMPFGGFLVQQGRMDFVMLVLVATVGSLVGSLVSYWVGLKLGKPFLQKVGKFVFLDLHHLELTEKWFAKQGSKTVFVARFVPVVRHLISISAGAGKMNLFKFCFFTFFGALGWNSILAFSGLVLKENWVQVLVFTEKLDIIILILFVVAILFFVLKARKK